MFALYGIAAGCLLLVVIQWRRTLQAYRNIPLVLVERTIFNALRTAKRPLVVAALCAGLAAFASDLLRYRLPLVFVIAAILVPLSYASLPPALLLLGASRPAIRPLLREITRAGSLFRVVPLFRVTHLLDRRKSGGPLAYITGDRTAPPVAWDAVVSELMDVVPVIVVDARVATPDVVAETILALQYRHKTLFVVDEGDSSEIFALLSLRFGAPEGIRTIAVKEVAFAVGEALQKSASRDPARFDNYRETSTSRRRPLLHYRDPALRFSFVLPEGWSLWRSAPLRCVVVSKDGAITVNAVEAEGTAIDRAARTAALLNDLRGRGFARAVARDDGRTFAGEENAVFYSCAAPDGRACIGVSAVRQNVQYSIEADEGLADVIDALEASFQFATKEEGAR